MGAAKTIPCNYAHTHMHARILHFLKVSVVLIVTRPLAMSPAIICHINLGRVTLAKTLKPKKCLHMKCQAQIQIQNPKPELLLQLEHK